MLGKALFKQLDLGAFGVVRVQMQHGESRTQVVQETRALHAESFQREGAHHGDVMAELSGKLLFIHDVVVHGLLSICAADVHFAGGASLNSASASTLSRPLFNSSRLVAS